MSLEKELQNALKGLTTRKVTTFPAEVISVDKASGTCSVKTSDLEFTDVRLASVTNAQAERFYLFPKVGSSVLVSPIDEDLHALYVEMYSEIEDCYLKIEKTELQIDKDGFLLKKENETLKKLMSDLIQAIRNMVFQTNTGITIQLLNDAEFALILNRFNNLLNDS